MPLPTRTHSHTPPLANTPTCKYPSIPLLPLPITYTLPFSLSLSHTHTHTHTHTHARTHTHTHIHTAYTNNTFMVMKSISIEHDSNNVNVLCAEGGLFQ